MRLICPKCAARYEVPEKNVPSDGREVQCSACGHTWFQTCSGRRDSQGLAKDFDTKRIEKAWDTRPARDSASFEVDGRVNETTANPLSRLHPTVAEVLKEEARREVAVRKAEKIETQPKLGAVKAPIGENSSLSGQKSSAEEIFTISAEEKDKETKAFQYRDPQRELKSENEKPTDLAGINETNNYSKSKNHKITDKSSRGHVHGQKKIKRLGLLTGIFTVACFSLIYHFSSDISEFIPRLVIPLNAYVEFVDRYRVVSDQWITSIIIWLGYQAEIFLDLQY